MIIAGSSGAGVQVVFLDGEDISWNQAFFPRFFRSARWGPPPFSSMNFARRLSVRSVLRPDLLRFIPAATFPASPQEIARPHRRRFRR
jgi:hypothetical protein